MADRTYTPPTQAQLVRFICVAVFGPEYGEAQERQVEEGLRFEWIRETWLRRHRELQEASWDMAEAEAAAQ